VIHQFTEHVTEKVSEARKKDFIELQKTLDDHENAGNKMFQPQAQGSG